MSPSIIIWFTDFPCITYLFTKAISSGQYTAVAGEVDEAV